jgi:hypothetical protein
MPTLNEHASTVLHEAVSLENIELETAAWIEYYLRNHGNIRHVWCNPKDRQEPWLCTISDGRTFQVEPKGGCPRGFVFVM